MKVLDIKLDSELDEIKIIPLSDLHLADKGSNKQLFRQAIEQIKNEPNTYTILNGDLIDTAIKDSLGNVYESTMTPMEELKELVGMLEPIKDKILVICQGNHERRVYKETSIDITKIVAMQLGIEERYCENMWYLFLCFGKNPLAKNVKLNYCITGYHGSGGGSTYTTSLKKAMNLQDTILADLYIISHFHKPVTAKNTIYLPVAQRHSIAKHDMYYLSTNSFLETEGSYAEQWGVPPANTSLCYVTLSGKEKKINITI